MTAATLYLHGTRGLQTLNPLTKLSLSALFLVAAAALPDLRALLLAFLLAPVPLALWSGVLRPFLRACLRLIWPFALSLAVIQGLFAPGTTVLLHLGPFALTLEGLGMGAFFTGRLLLGLGAATLLMLTTRPDTLLLDLTRRGLPPQIAYIVVTALQIIPGFQARAQSILDAQRARGLETEGSVLTRARALLPLIGPLLLSSLMELEERAIALEARGFNRRGPRTSWLTIADPPAERGLRWLMLAGAAALLALRFI